MTHATELRVEKTHSTFTSLLCVCVCLFASATAAAAAVDAAAAIFFSKVKIASCFLLFAIVFIYGIEQSDYKR